MNHASIHSKVDTFPFSFPLTSPSSSAFISPYIYSLLFSPSTALAFLVTICVSPSVVDLDEFDSFIWELWPDKVISLIFILFRGLIFHISIFCFLDNVGDNLESLWKRKFCVYVCDRRSWWIYRCWFNQSPQKKNLQKRVIWNSIKLAVHLLLMPSFFNWVDWPQKFLNSNRVLLLSWE